MSRLDEILQSRKNDAERLEKDQSMSVWRERALCRPKGPSFLSALKTDGLSLIAEIKRSSPSAGSLQTVPSPGTWALGYESGGASAISVLTEPLGFSGSLADLQEVRHSVRLPLLRKDFLFRPVQVYETRWAQADALLLILRFLKDPELKEMREASLDAGLDILAEVHDEAELDRAVSHGFPIIGVNCRDLVAMKTDLAVIERMRPKIPEACVKVAESGIRDVQDLRRVMDLGYDAALIGEALMRAPDPGLRLKEFSAACRGPARPGA